MGGVRVECGGKQKRGQPILWGDVGDGADVKEAFLEEIMHKLRAKAPMGGSQGGYRELGEEVQAISM